MARGRSLIRLAGERCGRLRAEDFHADYGRWSHRFAEAFEWLATYIMLWPEDGVMKKDDIRRIYDVRIASLHCPPSSSRFPADFLYFCRVPSSTTSVRSAQKRAKKHTLSKTRDVRVALERLASALVYSQLSKQYPTRRVCEPARARAYRERQEEQRARNAQASKQSLHLNDNSTYRLQRLDLVISEHERQLATTQRDLSILRRVLSTSMTVAALPKERSKVDLEIANTDNRRRAATEMRNRERVEALDGSGGGGGAAAADAAAAAASACLRLCCKRRALDDDGWKRRRNEFTTGDDCTRVDETCQLSIRPNYYQSRSGSSSPRITPSLRSSGTVVHCPSEFTPLVSASLAIEAADSFSRRFLARPRGRSRSFV